VPAWAARPDVQKAMLQRAKWLIGMDVDSALDDHPLLTYKVRGLGTTMPFRDGSFDLISANMVVEHLDDPAVFLSEVRRILRPDGRFIFHTTNFANWIIVLAYFFPEGIKQRIIWHLEKRRAEDVFPTRYRINTNGEIRKVAAGAGFSIDELHFVDSIGLLKTLGPAGWAEVLLAKVNGALGRGRYRSNIICVLRRK
jgi:SAM-dependent methyltransferase